MILSSLEGEELKLLLLILLVYGELRFSPMVVRAGTARTSFNHAIKDRVGSLVQSSCLAPSATLLLLRVINKASCRFSHWIKHGLSTVVSHNKAICVRVLLIKFIDSLRPRVAMCIA